MLNFMIYGVEKGEFSMAGLETTAQGVGMGPSPLESMKTKANARLLVFEGILGEYGIPDMASFFHTATAAPEAPVYVKV